MTEIQELEREVRQLVAHREATNDFKLKGEFFNKIQERKARLMELYGSREKMLNVFYIKFVALEDNEIVTEDNRKFKVSPSAYEKYLTEGEMYSANLAVRMSGDLTIYTFKGLEHYEPLK